MLLFLIRLINCPIHLSPPIITFPDWLEQRVATARSSSDFFFRHQETHLAYLLLTSTRHFSLPPLVARQPMPVKRRAHHPTQRAHSFVRNDPGASFANPWKHSVLHDAILAVRSTHPGHPSPSSNSNNSPSLASSTTLPHKSHDSTATDYPSSSSHDSDGNSLNIKAVQLVLRIAALTSAVCQDMMVLTGSYEKNDVAANTTNASNKPQEAYAMSHPATATSQRARETSSVNSRVGGSGRGQGNALFCYHTTGLLHYAVYVRSRPLVELFLRPPWYALIIIIAYACTNAETLY